MSIATIILGESGTGKSASMRNLDPANTLLIQAVKKPLPFKGSAWKPLSNESRDGNIIQTDDSAQIIKLCQKTGRKIIVIDDFQYVLANEFMRRTDEKGFDKFTEIGKHAWEVFNAVNRLADDVRVYILSHTHTDDSGMTKIKTIGKLLDDKITPEGMFTIVLRTMVDGDDYYFRTKNSGSDTVKAPMGMFEDARVPNDLLEVDRAICEYYDINHTENAA